jgi:hypothetical protein
MFPVIFGVLVGTYINNQTFRKSVDKGVQGLLGRGVDAINNIGKAGNYNAPVESSQPTNEDSGNINDSEFIC